MILKDFYNLNNSIEVPVSELVALTSPSVSGEKETFGQMNCA